MQGSNQNSNILYYHMEGKQLYSFHCTCTTEYSTRSSFHIPVRTGSINLGQNIMRWIKRLELSTFLVLADTSATEGKILDDGIGTFREFESIELGQGTRNDNILDEQFLGIPTERVIDHRRYQ